MQDWAASPILLAEFESGDNFMLYYQVGESRPDEEFDIADTLYVPVGNYDAKMGMGTFSTSPSRPLVFEANARLGNFYGGTIRGLGSTLTLAPSPQVAVSVGLDQNHVEVPSGEFTANLVSARGNYSFSTRLSANLLVQYNSLDENFSTNLRVNFIHRPGSDLFLVFTEERGVDGDLSALSDRGMVMKVTYLKRF
jgi:hypothetical protein